MRSASSAGMEEDGGGEEGEGGGLPLLLNDRVWAGAAHGASGGAALSAARRALHARHLSEGYANPTVLLGADCYCHARGDDCRGWYRGRAGTAAYYTPQMLLRAPNNERLSYSCEADWFSLGCTVFALLTGRSPFASGAGSEADNELTKRGRVAFARHGFSPQCTSFLTGLLCVDPVKRLGGGAEGWRTVMAHPWFESVPWGLLEERVLPPALLPPYTIPLNWQAVPEKIPGQYHAPGGAEACVALFRLIVLLVVRGV